MPQSGARADLYAPLLTTCMQRFNIVSDRHQAYFLAQIAHESGELRWTKEIWGPTHAQRNYEGRADLGNTNPGDGKRYLGRGLIQITGRANYAQLNREIPGDHPDFVSEPEHLEIPKWAAMSAAWFWHSRDLNKIADERGFIAVTTRINGGLNGIKDRQLYLSRAESLYKYA